VPAIHALAGGSGSSRAADVNRSAETQTPVVGVRKPDPASPNVIQQVEHVVPFGVWIALVAALALAATGGVATAVAGRRARRQAAHLAAVSAQALTDPLTGVLNRRGFLDALERELARARRYDRPVALAYVDVRGLKAVNDSEGHLAGDQLLREAAGMLEDSARADDVVGRIGGDELALLLGEQTSEGATVVANRIRAQVPARRAMLQLREPWDLTIGTATFPADGTTVDELLAAADRRLYEQRGIELRKPA
jgi:diguanylate cyclase (GGDEF)-like protein